MREEFLWVEKYRPKTIEECILPKGLTKTFREFVNNDEIPNLLLSGTAGIGKTTIARALCEQMNADYILMSGSEEGRLIDTLRNDIRNFASTVSLSGGRKVVILDEADYLNPQSVQPALRGFIEEFSKNCRFIFTCNFANRIIGPLHSRCSVIEFKIPKAEIAELAADFMNRVQEILEFEKSMENVDLDRGKECILRSWPWSPAGWSPSSPPRTSCSASGASRGARPTSSITRMVRILR